MTHVLYPIPLGYVPVCNYTVCHLRIFFDPVEYRNSTHRKPLLLAWARKIQIWKVSLNANPRLRSHVDCPTGTLPTRPLCVWVQTVLDQAAYIFHLRHSTADLLCERTDVFVSLFSKLTFHIWMFLGSGLYNLYMLANSYFEFTVYMKMTYFWNIRVAYMSDLVLLNLLSKYTF